MKIEQFLKGSTMNFKFNTAQLSRPQRLSLLKVLDVVQKQNENELEVAPVEFPNKLLVKLDGDIGMLLGWDVEKQSYSGLTNLTKPKSVAEALAEPESKKDTVDHGTETVHLPGELDLAPVIEKAKALARAYVGLTKPLNKRQLVIVWSEYCNEYVKELDL